MRTSGRDIVFIKANIETAFDVDKWKPENEQYSFGYLLFSFDRSE